MHDTSASPARAMAGLVQHGSYVRNAKCDSAEEGGPSYAYETMTGH